MTLIHRHLSRNHTRPMSPLPSNVTVAGGAAADGPIAAHKATVMFEEPYEPGGQVT